MAESAKLDCMTETNHEETTQKHKAKRLSKLQRHLIIFVAGVVVAFAATTAVRFTLVKDTAVHYHANFSLYVNGQEDPFKSFTFYEEIADCTSNELMETRPDVHMHDQNSHLVHVEANAITWSDFFNNLGYTLGDNLVKTDNGVYITGDDGNKLTFLLNGKPIDHVANTFIGNEDVLLINYGKDSDATLTQRFNSITRDAHKANVTKDPAACSGGQELTFWSKLKQALGAAPDER